MKQHAKKDYKATDRHVIQHDELIKIGNKMDRDYQDGKTKELIALADLMKQ